MFTRTADALVNRPLEEVYAFLEVPDNRPLYDESVEDQEFTSSEPHGVGSTGVTRMRFLGRRYERHWVVVDHEPGLKVVMESKARPFPTVVGFELAGHERMMTWVELAVTGRPGGLSRAMEPLMARAAERRLARVLDRLVRLLESGAARSAT